MKSHKIFAAAGTLLLTGAFAGTAFAQTAAKVAPEIPSAPLAQTLLPTSDKGAFRILLSGAEVGNETFEMSTVGNSRMVRSETVVRAPGQPEAHSSGELRVAPDGGLLAYKWTSQADKKASGAVEYKDGSAKTTLDLGAGKDPYEADFVFPSPRVAILDNNLYSQYLLVAQLYDWTTRGPQNFPVLIPQDLTPGTITVESLGPKAVDGGTFEALRVNSADLEILAYYDARRRLMRLEVPAAMVSIVRR